jgi:hypothetical protein
MPLMQLPGCKHVGDIPAGKESCKYEAAYIT